MGFMVLRFAPSGLCENTDDDIAEWGVEPAYYHVADLMLTPYEPMFREMEACNFDVHMSITAGQQEKCIDISLAVEMMCVSSE